MKGRLEHQRIYESKLKAKLETMPSYMTDFYYSLQKKEYLTVGSYIRYVSNFLMFVGDGKQLDLEKVKTINSTWINRYMDSIRYKNGTDRTVENSGAYRATTWSAINSFFEFLIRSGEIKDNPCAMTDRPDSKDEVKKVYMNPEEIQTYVETVLDGAGSSRARARQREWRLRDLLMVLLFVETGMRAAALSEINVDDLDIEKRELTVIDKRRKTFVHKISEATIKIYCQWLDKRSELLGDVDCEALFISNQRVRMSTRSIANLVEKYAENVGKHITPHKFRSSYATNLYNATGDIYKVQRCMGHESPNTTQRYVQADDSYRDEATAIMSSMISLNI